MRMPLLYSVSAVAMLIGSVATVFPAHAAPGTLTQQLAPKLEPILGPKMVEKVMPSAHAGLYEVLTHPGIVYTDKTASFVSFGLIVATATKVNLTEKRLQEFSKFVFKGLPFKTSSRWSRVTGRV
jgi:hypothetical protein